MEEIRTITVGVGVHPRTGEVDVGSLRAARQAAWVAQRTGATVTLLTAAWAEDSSGPLELSSNAMDELGLLSTRVIADGVKAEIAVVEDYPWRAIVQRAVAGEADLVIAGKFSQPDGGRRRVGSTAAKLLRTCPSPVWLVQPDHDLNHRHVLATTDLSDVARRCIEAAAWVASNSQGELHVLHAWNLSFHQQRASADHSEEEYMQLVDSARAHSQQALEHEVAALDIDPTLHLERGEAHAEILKEVEEEQPDLLVMGSLSEGCRPGFDVGTIAERVLDQVDSSLLTFKPKDFVCPLPG